MATVVGWLTATCAICQFIAAPALGVLSDRFGRRPLLLICLLGSAFGCLLFGIGGALWVLFAGRIIDGLTGGDFSILAAYIGDVSAPEERGKLFGQIGGIGGIGLILGPVIGAVAIVPEPALMLAGIFFFAFGSGLLEPALNGLISAAAGPSEQGIVQGEQQALRAPTEIGGPLLAGVLYTQLGGETPYWLGALLLLLGIITIRLAAPHIALSRATAEPSPATG